jgi:hypothetical protein
VIECGGAGLGSRSFLEGRCGYVLECIPRITVKNPYEPPTYGVRNLAIERRMAGNPPASLEGEDEAESVTVGDEDDAKKAEKAAPANKARKAAPANKGKK